MKQRDQVAMTADEVAAFLAGSRKLQLATINPDGTPHLVTMYYVMLGRADHVLDLPRLAEGAATWPAIPGSPAWWRPASEYFDLRGVQVQGVARRSRTRPPCWRSAARIAGGHGRRATPARLDDYVEHAARKRVGYVVEPGPDHLLGPRQAAAPPAARATGRATSSRR